MDSSSVTRRPGGRIGKWDNLKGFLMIMVVLGHFSNQYAAWSSMMRSISLLIYTFHMPLFIFLAGLFTRKWDQDHPFNWSRPIYFFLLGYILKILIYLVKILYHQKAVFTPLADTGIPWYMFAMAAFMILTWLLRKCDPWILMPVWIGAACLAGYAEWINSFLNLSRIIVFFPFFYLGYILDQGQVKTFTDRIWVRAGAPFILALAAWLCFSRIDKLFPYIRLFTARNPYSTINVPGCGFADRLAFYMIGLVMGAALISLTPSSPIPLLNLSGKRSLQIYFWHRLVLYVLMFSGLVSWVNLCLHLPHWELWIPVFSVLLTFLLTPEIFGRPLDLLRKGVEKALAHFTNGLGTR